MTPQRLTAVKRLHFPRNWDDIDDLYGARTELLVYVTKLEEELEMERRLTKQAAIWLAEVLELPEESILETIIERANT